MLSNALIFVWLKEPMTQIQRKPLSYTQKSWVWSC